MAEIKNNFTGSKMNQDIDDRLMPNNEYRYALNLEVNKSQSSDAGVLQNVLGNSIAVDFRSISGVSDIECIGVYADAATNNIYVFLTNNSLDGYNISAKNYIYVYNNKRPVVPPFLSNPILLVKGEFLNFSMQSPIFAINLIEDLLFWTDNRNQPRRINVKRASSAGNGLYYTNEDQISVAKINPYQTINLYKESALSAGNFETTMKDVVSEKLPDGVTVNPYYNSDYIGDPAYLSDKYVRFSYRFKFEDGEYSIMAPFTQIAYIPKQDGYFMYKPPLVSGEEPEKDDETSAYRSTVVEFMQNKVNNILLQIELPGQANLLLSVYKISEIEILYKDANSLAVSVVDSIPTDPTPSVPPMAQNFFETNALVYEYNYQSKKPFKTLPEKDIIRVYDRVPIKALAQEVVGNRIVYSNYQDKATYPKYLDYNVGYSPKRPFGFTSGKGTSIIEYPNHSVKENRNYQVGIVLCDKFGRQSGVILSDKVNTAFPGLFGSSSLYVPYLSDSDDIIPSEWPGGSLKILFNEPISPDEPNVTTGWPGIYNGDYTSSSYNPLGWYSYKIVVKQTEQDYYNVYLPGVMAAYPADLGPFTELGKTSHTVLINDNINKVPRDLTEVGPNQLQFRSSVVLYPRVNNNIELYNNQQYYPGNTYAFASTIATSDSLFGTASTVTGGFAEFYQVDSNPLIARLSTSSKLGVVSTESVINLSVYETKPFESKLDIYWETSSVGLISELNIAINAGATESVDTMIGGTSFILLESDAPGKITIPSLRFENLAGIDVVPTSVQLISANNKSVPPTSILNKFTLEETETLGVYRLKTAAGAYFYYGYTPGITESYVFTVRATVGFPPVSKDFEILGSLTDVNTSISNKITTISKNTGELDVYQFFGSNGSNASGPYSQADLVWAVVGDARFSIDVNGMLKTNDTAIEGTYNLTITLTGATGQLDSCDVSVVYPFIEYVNFSDGYIKGPYTNSENGYHISEGTLDIVGKSASFAAFASVNSATGSSLVETELKINNVVRATANRYVVGEDISSYFTLTPGTYSYRLQVRTEFPVGYFGSGTGGIKITQ